MYLPHLATYTKTWWSDCDTCTCKEQQSALKYILLTDNLAFDRAPSSPTTKGLVSQSPRPTTGISSRLLTTSQPLSIEQISLPDYCLYVEYLRSCGHNFIGDYLLSSYLRPLTDHIFMIDWHCLAKSLSMIACQRTTHSLGQQIYFLSYALPQNN